LEQFGGIWMILDESGGICERKTLLRMKKKADQAGFKGTRTGMKFFACFLKFGRIFFSVFAGL